MRRAAFFLLLAAFAVLAATAIRTKSPSGDEMVHLAAGYAQWQNSTVRLNREHPPLVKMIDALPLASSTHLDVTEMRGWKAGRQWIFFQALFFESGLDVDAVFFRARMVALLFGLTLIYFIYRFSRELWGETGGLLSLALAALCPNFLAHAPLIHTDIPITLGFVLTCYRGLHYEREPTRKNVLWLALALAFALAVKFSGVLLLPYVAVLWGVFAVHAWKSKRTEVLLHALCLLAVPVVLVTATYGTPFNLKPYFEGLFSVYQNHDPNYAFFMNGKFSRDGFFLYYPYAMLLKLPLPTLLLVGASFLTFRRGDRNSLLHLFVPAATVLLAGMVARSNIGIRHAFPCFPALFIAAGALANSPVWKRARLPAVALLGWLVFETVHVYPHFLPYFNQLAGGPRGGLRYLDDSNVDWGEDLKTLPHQLRALGIPRVAMEFFGPDRAAAREIEARPMSIYDHYFPEGDFVVSAHYLRRNTLITAIDGYSYDWLERYRPAAVVGHSLYIYRFRIGEKSEFRDGINFIEKSAWWKHGFATLQALVERNPTFDAALLDLGLAHVLHGEPRDGLIYLDRAAELSPHEPVVLYQRAKLLARLGEKKRAREAKKKLLELHPNFTPARELQIE